jgi:predicted DNA-binding mobile mystery protein A
MNKHLLKISQIDAALKSVHAPPRPLNGWIQTIRTSLGMTAKQLAVRLNIAQASLSNLEKSEAADTISLQSLRRAAQALDCELVYALVPRKPLSNMVNDKAAQLASQSVQRVRHTMLLEQQSTSGALAESQISARKAALMAGRWSKLWAQ